MLLSEIAKYREEHNGEFPPPEMLQMSEEDAEATFGGGSIATFIPSLSKPPKSSPGNEENQPEQPQKE